MYRSVTGFSLEMNHWLKHMQLTIDIESTWAWGNSFQPTIDSFGNDLPWTHEWSPKKILCNFISLRFPVLFPQQNLRCGLKPGGSSLAPFYKGILDTPSSLAPFKTPAGNTMQLEWTLYNRYPNSTAATSSKCQCPTSSDWQPNWQACTMISERHSRQWNLGYRGSAPLMRYVWKLVCLPLWLLFITVPVLFKVFSLLYKGTLRHPVTNVCITSRYTHVYTYRNTDTCKKVTKTSTLLTWPPTTEVYIHINIYIYQIIYSIYIYTYK